MNFVKPLRFVGTLLVAMLLSSSFCRADSMPSDQSCDDLEGYINSKKNAEIGPNSSEFLKNAYSSFAGYLMSRVKGDQAYCGYTAANVIFLLRQSVVEFELGDSSQMGENIAAFTHADVSVGMSELFSKGKFGFPKDVELANCWSNPKISYKLCEALEQRKYCHIRVGVAPRGFQSLRPAMKRTKPCS